MASYDVIHRGGENRVLALKPRTISVGASAPYYGDKFKIIPRDKWKPILGTAAIRSFIEAHSDVPATDQNGEGACGGYSAVTALYHCRRDAGFPFVELAPGRLYHYSGGGQDNGSQLSDNLTYLEKYGCPKKTSRKQELDYRSRWTAAETEEAKQFRITLAADCPDFETLASAVQCGHHVQHGILCGSNYELDDTGLWIRPPKGNSGGHAQATPAGGLCYDESHGFGLLVAGSWSTQFGYHGWYVVPEAYFDRSVFNDGWACQASTIRPEDTSDIPEVA